jgi:NADH dehydrogenase FAD-containing subunit
MGAPLVQTSSTFASESWLRFEEIPALKQSNFRIVQGKVSALDASGRSLNYVSSDGTTRRLEYDYAVLATGKRRSWPVAPRAYSKAAFLLESKLQLTSLSRARRIAVVGGGAVGVEMAAEIKRTWPESLVTLVQSRSTLLSSEPLPAEFKETTLKMLEEAGVQVRLCCRINDTRKIVKAGSDQPMWEARLSNGDVLLYDELVDTISRVKPESYVPSSFLTESGKFQVTPT